MNNNTFTWTSKDGKEIKLVAECKSYVVDSTVYSDDRKVKIGRKRIETEANLVAYYDDKQVGDCWNTSFWKIIDIPGGMKRIWGIDKIGFDAERAAEIEKFLSDVIESGKDEEVKAMENAAKEKKIAEDIAKYTSVIERAESQTEIMTAAEQKEWRKNYNNLVNEGGEGCVPYLVSLEEYEDAKSKLVALINSTKKFKVVFEGNYMICKAIILDEDCDEIEIELYSEVSCDDYNDECSFENKYGETEFDVDKFDEIAYPILKENIIEQAKEHGISKEQLEFWWD